MEVKMKIRFENLQIFENYIKHLQKEHFNSKESILNEKYVHANGITKELATKIYTKESKSYFSWCKRDKILSKLFNTRQRLPIHKDYCMIIDLMNVLNKETLTNEDINKVLNNSEYYYEKFFSLNNITNIDNSEISK